MLRANEMARERAQRKRDRKSGKAIADGSHGRDSLHSHDSHHRHTSAAEKKKHHKDDIFTPTVFWFFTVINAIGSSIGFVMPFLFQHFQAFEQYAPFVNAFGV